MLTIDTTINSCLEETRQSEDRLDQSNLSIVRLGQDAWARVRGDHSWKDWLQIGAALCIGRTETIREAHVNAPNGRNYNIAYATWLKKYGFDTIDKGDRARLFDVMDHLVEIETWRAQLTRTERSKLNHPSTIWRKWKAATVISDSSAPPKTSTIAKLKEINIELQEKLHRAERELSRGGGDLWSSDDTAEDIAAVMVGKLSPSKAERVARAILKKLSANTSGQQADRMTQLRAAVVTK